MIKNAKTLPQVYFGLHMVEGVAEYREPGKDPYRIYIGEECIKNMDSTFPGRPVYVDHVDEVDLENIQTQADGYVVDSFFNTVDGKHWAKFIVVSDKGHEAIRNGWKLSNAYIPKAFSGGGLCHGVEYQKEVTQAEYEHLAIVKVPRYEESIILTPEQFKSYNSDKELELMKVANSNEQGETQMLNFFKKTKVENSTDFENMSVTLPKSKVEKTLAQLVTEADAIQNMQGYANGDHMVKVGNDEMTVNDLVKKHMSMMDEMKMLKEPDQSEKEGDKQLNDEQEEMEEKEKKKENGEQTPHDKEIEMKKNDDEGGEEDEEKKKVKKNNFDKIKNAPYAAKKVLNRVDLSEDKLARGKARYGSN